MIDLAYAMAGGGAGGEGGMSAFSSFLPLIAIIVIFYFILIRPQQKRTKQHQQMLSTLKEGDKVITNSGIYGTVVKVEENALIIEIADRVRIKMAKGYIASITSQVNPNAVPPPKA